MRHTPPIITALTALSLARGSLAITGCHSETANSQHEPTAIQPAAKPPQSLHKN